MSAPMASKIRKPSMAEHGHQGEGARAWGVAGGGEQGFELQLGEPQGGRFRGHRGAVDVLGRGVLEQAIDDAGLVEPATTENRRAGQ